MVSRLLAGAAAATGFIVAIFAAAIAFGGPIAPPPLDFVRDATIARDRSDLPPIRHYRARDGAALAYRAYPAANSTGAAILVHGSVGSSADMHEVAKALRDAGIDAYAPDMRGHGASGPRGDIAYVGQLEDDLGDFLDNLDHDGAPPRRVLIGHSAGGGFALRVAARPLGDRFAGAILLAPFLGADAPTNKPGVRGWVGVGLPRLAALEILDRLGIRVFGGLPVLAFAITPDDAKYVTPTYSYRLFANFGPDRDWHRDIADTRGKLIVLIGDSDQLFDAAQYRATLAAAPQARLEILPGIDHMSISGAPAALQAIVAAAQSLLAANDR
jgi:alpha-beta hydrolase superfamily lysophospholipase